MSTHATQDAGYHQALAFLYGRLNFERTDQMPYDKAEFKLDRMRQLLERLGNPQDSLRIVHIAGTKGKGSTSQLLSAMLTLSGYRTGCYTSPHLRHLEERFAVDGRACTPQQVVQLVNRIVPTIERLDQEAQSEGTVGPTFFEITTAMALLHFQSEQCDWSVLEVGLGGRLDSTNVCHPLATVITSISFDHMRQLGNTLAAIAGEKAGIIKHGIPVVTGVVDQEPLDVIVRVAEEQRAPLYRLGRDFDVVYHAPSDAAGGDRPHMELRRLIDDELQVVAQDLQLASLGRHQATNAALAWTVCDLLEARGYNVPVAARRQALAQGAIPARIEMMSHRPAVVIDTAHNAASIRALLDVLRESFPQQRKHLVLGATREKDVDGMLLELVSSFETIICTQYRNNPRGMPADELARHARRIATAEGCVVDFYVRPSPQEAWSELQRIVRPEDLVCVTGSFFLAAEMRAVIDAES